MKLSKFSYYSDFVVYPIVVAGLSVADSMHGVQAGAAPRLGEWLAACLCGFAIWTLLEYALHRVALHFMAYFSPMHALHHANPLGLIGTPAWISVPVWLGVILLPLSYFLSFNVADGATVGIMLGYWWYGIVHHMIHHDAHRRAGHRGFEYFNGLRAWHMRHHHSPKKGNFGVTTAVWDHVFGTAIGARRSR